MRKKLLIFLTLIHCFGTAWSSVVSLEDGACWLDRFGKEGWKIVSFSRKHAYFLVSDDLNNFKNDFESYMEQFGNHHGEVVDFNVHIHCGAYGSNILINVKTQKNNFCVQTWMDKDTGKLEEFQVNPNSSRQEGACLGNKPGELIVKVKKGASTDKLIDQFNQARYRKIFFYFEALNKNTILVKLHRKFFYREHHMRSFLEREKAFSDLIEYIEFSDLQLPVGSAYHLWFK
jgi:hypothetical protein